MARSAAMFAVFALLSATAVVSGCGDGDEAELPSLATGGERWSAISRTIPAKLDPASSNPCGTGSGQCIAEVATEMARRQLLLAASCDHNAAFSLMYLRLTESVEAPAAGFRDPSYLNHLDALFARLYFRAIDSWRAGGPVPDAWRVAFEAADDGAVAGIGDLLLGMNAHISRDLPYALEAAGLRSADGRSARPDYDRVNELIEGVQGPILREASEQFDPTILDSTLPALGVDARSVGRLIARWRDEAWRNAAALLAAPTSAERERVVETIERGAAGRGELIASLTSTLVLGPAAEERDRYCRSR